MTNPCRWCRVSHDCVLQINVVLVVVGLIFLLDVFSHLYLKTAMFPGLRLYPVALRAWLFWVRGLTLVAYVINAILGVRMARRPSIIKFAGYMLIGCVVLLYTASIAVTRFLYRRRFEFFVQMMVLQMWLRESLGKVELEFACCGKTGVADYQTASSNRSWASGSCCERPGCPGCTAKLTEYLWTVEMDVARDNIVVSLLLLVGLVVMVSHFKDGQFEEDDYDSDDSEEGSEQGGDHLGAKPTGPSHSVGTAIRD
ncbi:uncharacterized protein LOC108099989 [Drosophila ficusphila]|uniref:uncharacterized protein LOC108099989 n=1 Tax=Drosophila ficusphila TaxID=30025 RepID=UPI0007E6804B|nr:uncharacterized protein LOC108099989 [Drosophila ficusphila]